MNWAPKLQLSSKLLLAIVPIIAGSLLMLGWIVYSQLRANSEQDLVQQMDLMLTQTQHQTESFLSTVKANVTLFSSSNLIERYALEDDENDRYFVMQPALLKLFKSYRKSYPEYQEIRLLLPDGYEDTRLASPELTNKREEEFEQPWFQELLAIKNKRSFFSKIGPNDDDGTTTLLVAQPIWLKDIDVQPDKARPKLRGFLAVTASLDFLEREINTLKVGNAGYLMALDSDGQVLFHPDQSKIGTSRRTLLHDFTRARANSGTAAVEQDHATLQVLGRWLHEDLLLMAVLPESEFADASQRVAWSVAAVTLAAIMLASLLLFLFLQTVVLKPISSLRNSAIAIGEGQLDGQVDIDSSDEIGDLASAIREMKQNLATSITDLRRSHQELRQSHEEIEKLAHRDALTGLPNRRLFLNLVENAVDRARDAGQDLAIMFLDLDDFKRVNDSIGHEAGDILLQEVSDRLRLCVRGEDATQDSHLPESESANPVARLGGDEFTVMLSTHGSRDQSAAVAEQIIASLTKPVLLGDQEYTVGTSIGIAMFPGDSDNVDGLVKCADMAMYDAKMNNKNCYRFYRSHMHSAIEERLVLENELRTAIKRSEFEMYYQLQFDNASEQITGVEALMRWRHPDKGIVDPEVFIPVAEDISIIGELGQWGISESCRQWREWQDLGIAPMRIAVNVSQRQFDLSDLHEIVQKAKSAHDVADGALQLEITESSMMEAPTEVVFTLEALRDNGIQVAMDHFGTGFSSLSALTFLPIDTLKIDRCFIASIESDSRKAALANTVFALARTLDLEIIAEGVEEPAQREYLRNNECDVIQGFLLSRPMPAARMTEFLLEHHVAATPVAIGANP